MAPSPIPKFDNPKMDRMPALQLFGAGPEKRIYAVPPYTEVKSLDFDDPPFEVESGEQDYALSATGYTYLAEVIADARATRRDLCSQRDYCTHPRQPDHLGHGGQEGASVLP